MNGKQARRKRHALPVIHPPGPWADLVEAACDHDRAYFERHPDRKVYVRKRMPGEFGPAEGEAEIQAATHVEVTRNQGFRTRRPVQCVSGHDYPMGKIPFEHFEALMHYAAGKGMVWRPVADDEVDD
jgi:hypothetical protein